MVGIRLCRKQFTVKFSSSESTTIDSHQTLDKQLLTYASKIREQTWPDADEISSDLCWSLCKAEILKLLEDTDLN